MHPYTVKFDLLIQKFARLTEIKRRTKNKSEDEAG